MHSTSLKRARFDRVLNPSNQSNSVRTKALCKILITLLMQAKSPSSYIDQVRAGIICDFVGHFFNIIIFQKILLDLYFNEFIYFQLPIQLFDKRRSHTIFPYPNFGLDCSRSFENFPQSIFLNFFSFVIGYLFTFLHVRHVMTNFVPHSGLILTLQFVPGTSKFPHFLHMNIFEFFGIFKEPLMPMFLPNSIYLLAKEGSL